MSNTYSLRCRWDQTFRFPRDFSAYDTIIQAGAVARMEMTFANGFVLEFSSNSGDGKDGTFVYDIDKNGWFICSIDKLAALYASFGGSSKALSATWAARLEKDGASQVVMSGRAIWAAPDISETADSSSNGTGTGTFGQTVLVEGEDDTTPRVLIPPYSTGSVNWSDILNKPAFGTASLLAASALLLVANNLSDLASKPTARTNLGLGSIATITAPGGTSTFLRADGTWATAGASAGGSDGQLQYNSATTLAGSPLWRESANAIAQRNGVNAQASFLYNTFTDVSNYERGVFDWSTTANTLRIGTSKLGTGVARALQFVIGDTNIAQFNASGHLLWNTDATYDIGASGATRPRNGYFAGTLSSGPHTIAGGTVTTSTPVLDLSQTWNAGAVVFTGVKLNVTNTASSSSSMLIDLQVGGLSKFSVRPSGLILASDASLTGSIRVDGGINALVDTFLVRDAANIWAQRNSTSAQTFRVYNTFTDASNYERAIFDWQGSANVLTIGTENLGTGSARNMRFVIGGSVVADYGVSTSGVWSFNNFKANTIRIGNINSNDNTVTAFTIANGTANTVFGGALFQFGGTTSSFPALKRSSAILQARLADDSGYTTIDALHRLQGAAPATAGDTGTAGDIRYDSGNIYICTAANTWKRVAVATF